MKFYRIFFLFILTVTILFYAVNACSRDDCKGLRYDDGVCSNIDLSGKWSCSDNICNYAYQHRKEFDNLCPPNSKCFCYYTEFCGIDHDECRAHCTLSGCDIGKEIDRCDKECRDKGYNGGSCDFHCPEGGFCERGTTDCYYGWVQRNDLDDKAGCDGNRHCCCYRRIKCGDSYEKCQKNCKKYGCKSVRNKLVNCSCVCAIPQSDERLVIDVRGYGFDDCMGVCGGICGSYSVCGNNLKDYCIECCENYCKSEEHDFKNSGAALENCKKACEGKCEYTKGITNIYNGIKIITIIIAALIFAICGIKFITAETTESKARAKRCLVYVVMGLIIVGIALELVNLLYKPITQPTTPKQKCEEIGGVCLSVPCEEKGCSDLNGICEDEEKPHCCKCDGDDEDKLVFIDAIEINTPEE